MFLMLLSGEVKLGKVYVQVSAVVQVVGIILCLHAATKISHRAQAIASVASKWHAIMSCSSTDSTQIRASPSGVHLEATTNPPISFRISPSESDVESMDHYMRMPANNSHFSSYMSMSSYHRRQAFGEDCFTLFSFLFRETRHGHKKRKLNRNRTEKPNPKPNQSSKITERFLYFYNQKTETEPRTEWISEYPK